MDSWFVTKARRKAMLYLVEAWATIERGDAIDQGEGPGPFFAKLVERFQPQAIYGDPTRRHIFIVVDLENPAKMAEIMYTLTWFAGNEPTFTPLMPPETYLEALANAKKIIAPLWATPYVSRRRT
jgi:hypothetical protein